jgi:hypothetical protein
MPNNEVHYLAVGGGVAHYALLPDPVVKQWAAIEEALRQLWKTGDRQSKVSAVSLSGCLEKLSSGLLQGHRMRNHHDTLLCHAKALKTSPAGMAALRGAEACADFEGLLLQARAALDRLAWLVTSRFKNPSQSFRKIGTVLSAFEQKDDDAGRLLSIIHTADSWFDGTFGKLEEARSLRDLVAHHHSLMEGIRTCFAISRVSQSAALLVDCEVSLPGQPRPVPVLGTAHQSVKWLSYLVLNCAAVIARTSTLDPDGFEPLWHNRTVPLSKYVLVEPQGSPLGPHTLHTVRTMTLDGFVFGTDNVDPRIFEHAVEL